MPGSSRRNSRLPVTHLCLLSVFFAAFSVSAQSAIPHLYERTTYVEGLASPLAWWANPALTAGCEAPTLFTANASPVGEYYTISSVRFFIPLPRTITLGLGIMGAGADQTGSLSATGDGVSYESDFFFSRPSFQAGLAAELPLGLSVGGIVSLGLERLSVGVGLTDEFFLLGLGAGLLSPAVAGVLQFSLAAYWAGHFQYESYWDSDLKAGLIATIPGGIVKLKLEYSQPMPEAMQFDTYAQGYSYEVLSLLAAVRTARFLTVLAGYSTDFGTADGDGHNGNALHAGVELPRTPQLPFFGGYELGVSLTHRLHILHRIWLGFGFGPRATGEGTESIEEHVMRDGHLLGF